MAGPFSPPVLPTGFEGRVAPEVRLVESDGAPRLVGHASVFGSWSDDLGGFIERIRPAAFAKVLAGRPDVRALLNHDENIVLGRTRNETLLLREDERGLADEIKLPDTQWGRDTATLVRRGDVTGQSFVFRVGIDQWDTTEELWKREIIEFSEIRDVGPVTFPAYPATDISARALLIEGARSAGRVIAPPAPKPARSRVAWHERNHVNVELELVGSRS